jgi:F-type H+-transporting ATPase subunit gamma
MNYEPKKEIIFQNYLPLFLNSLLYYLFLRTQVVENLLRKSNIENALENTENLLKQNNRFLNHLRQQKITNEIIEIISALEVILG